MALRFLKARTGPMTRGYRHCGAGLSFAALLAAHGFAACSSPNPVGSSGIHSGSGGQPFVLGTGGQPFVLGSAGRPGSAVGGQWGQSGTPPSVTDNCGAEKTSLHNVPDVLLVLDKSASMNDLTVDAAGKLSSTRYKDIVAALNQVLPGTDAAINWGLELYPHEPGGGCTPGEVDVPIKPRNGGAVAAAYDPKVVTPGGLTPTTASIRNAVRALAAMSDDNPKYIVLATDGEPNCDTVESAIAAIHMANQAGIPVFVVSMSNEGSPQTLNKMAEAGGKPVSDPADPTAKYYKADTTDKMVAAMKAIGKDVVGCNFKLPSPPPDPDNVLVSYDDGHSAGPGSTTWGYTDASRTAITLYGSDCANVLGGTYKSVEILYGCPANCGAQIRETSRSVADVLLVLDKSASMNDLTNNAATGVWGTRYKDVVAGLNQVLPATNAAINWGLELYPREPGGGCTPGEVDIPVRPKNAGTVSAFFDPSVVTPSGLTPTSASMRNAVKTLQALNDGNPKYIVLATDGEPNCDTGPGSASDNAVAAVRAAKDAGIPVFVISLAAEGSPETLNRMAEAGGKPANDPIDAKTKYYKASTTAEMVAVMNAIGKQVLTCEFKLPSPPPVPDNVLVIFDDGHRALPSSTTWGYTDASNSTVSIYGDDCSKLLNGTYHQIRILYGCPEDAQLIP